MALPARLARSAAAPAASPIAAEPATAATTEATFGLGPRLVDGQAPTAHLELVELGSGLLGFLVGRHLDEREPSGAAGRPVTHDPDRFTSAGLPQQFLHLPSPPGIPN